MLPAEIEKPLSLIELQCAAVAVAVESGEPLGLESAAAALKQAALDFSRLLERLSAPQRAGAELRLRLEKLAGRLGQQRENLIRRSVVVERAVQAMVPATRQSTYARPTGPYAGGATGRASGAYKSFAA